MQLQGGEGMSLPEKFLWGGSISAAQAEGAWDEGGKSPVQIDYADAGSAKRPRFVYYRNADGSRGTTFQFSHIPEGARYELFEEVHYTNHIGSDFYHTYKDDIALFAQMGLTSFNTTISWARLYPHGVAGGLNMEGVKFYRDLFTELRKNNIEPVITLYKYDEPVYFEETYGGWQNRKMIDEFVTFAQTCFKEYGDLVHRWLTFNEINVLLQAVCYPQVSSQQAEELYLSVHNQMVAAARCVKAAHAIDPAMQVGCMIAGCSVYPLTSDPKDVMAAYSYFQEEFCYCADTMVRGEYPSFAPRIWRQYGVEMTISEEDRRDLLEGQSDFIGFSYYFSNCVTTHKPDENALLKRNCYDVKNPYIGASDWGWQIDPTGFKFLLHLINDRYQKPILDIENGLGAYDKIAEDGGIHDDYRIDYHRQHIAAMKEAVEEGVNLIGYTVWGILDLVSFGTGQMDKRYGMIYVDMDDQGNGTLERKQKDSFYWYRKVIASNGEDLR